MKPNRTVLALSFLVVFLLGCVTAQVLPVPRARAGTQLQRWEYFCTDARIAKMNEAGAQGWELVSVTAVQTKVEYRDGACFKRPLP